MLYLVRVQKDQEPVQAFSSSFPLHLSSLGLRLLLEMPRPEALEWLNTSRERRGWARPTQVVPASPGACLRTAGKLIRHECLPLVDWQEPGRLSASIPVDVPPLEPPAALALSGPQGRWSVEDVVMLLQEGRRGVEKALGT